MFPMMRNGGNGRVQSGLLCATDGEAAAKHPNISTALSFGSMRPYSRRETPGSPGIESLPQGLLSIPGWPVRQLASGELFQSNRRCRRARRSTEPFSARGAFARRQGTLPHHVSPVFLVFVADVFQNVRVGLQQVRDLEREQIGRASCRERV